MSLYIAAIVVIGYVVFAVAAEQFNPFRKPRGHSKRYRWRRGRRISLAVQTFGALALVGSQVFERSLLSAL